MSKKIIVIDDDPHILDYMKEHLSLNNYDVHEFQSPVKALEALPDIRPDLLITDIKMDELTGDDVLNHVAKHHPSVGVIMITGFGNISHSVRAMRKGAFDYITKPFSGREFISRIRQYFDHPGKQPLAAGNAQQKKAQDETTQRAQSVKETRSLIGEHPNIQKLLNILPQIAPTHAPVMIQGESGTGKEVYASLIHRYSNRSGKPFVKINCANLPSELVESTLFGHVKGAFTGATEDKTGAFYEAEGGTILLDEVTEIDIKLQPKLLRVLQEREYKPVGSQKVQRADVRIISTTNRNIANAINENIFRKDLFFRLNVFPVQMPALRQRKNDIPALAAFFCKKYAKKYNLPSKSIPSEVKQKLMQKDWSGNVRELENHIQRGVIMAGKDTELKLSYMENPLFQNAEADLTEEVISNMPVLPIAEMELQMIKKALERTNGNQKEAAKLLQISDRTIRNKLKNIDFPD